jgi:hypothetical protein
MAEAVLGVKGGERARFEKRVTAEDVARFGQCIAHAMLSAGFISAALG